MLTLFRSTNLILSVWLTASAFLWVHAEAQLANAVMVGIVTSVVSAFALHAPQVRWMSGIFALWLFVSAFALAHMTIATVWNSVIVAVLMFSVSVAETMGPVGDEHIQR